MRKTKKYLIKESELKEIIKEMILMEVYNPNNYRNMFTTNYQGKSPTLKSLGTNVVDMINGNNGAEFPGIESLANLRDALEGTWKGGGDLLKALGGSLPEGWKEKINNGDWGWLTRELASILGTGNADWSNLGHGTNSDAHEELSVSKAVRNIIARSTDRYIPGVNGHCAANVRAALNCGGLSLPSGMGGGGMVPAKMYIAILPANGWYEISQSDAVEACDVMVMDDSFATLSNGQQRRHPSGHISMCVGGGQWCSDFKQYNDPVAIKGTPDWSKVHFYRYRNLQP